MSAKIAKAILAIVMCSGLCACGFKLNTIAPTPTPNIIAKQKIAGAFDVTVQQVVDERFCSQQPSLRDFCVTRMQSAVTEGLKAVLGDFFEGGGDKYKASFKMVELSHGYAPGNQRAIKLSMKWQFVLESPSGEPILQLAETTESPDVIVNTRQKEKLVGSLLNAVLEEIAKALNDADLAVPEAPPTDEPGEDEPAEDKPAEDKPAEDEPAADVD